MRHQANELMLPEEVCELLGVAPTVLREMRKTRSGLTFIAFSPRAAARYRYEDVVKWIFDVVRRIQVEGDARKTAWEREQAIAARKHLRLVRRRTPPASARTPA